MRILRRIKNRITNFIKRHAAKIQIGMSAIGTGMTIFTIAGLIAMQQYPLAAALTGWSIICNIVSITTASQAQQAVAA